MKEAFLALYAELDRKGPGVPEDVVWAVATGGVPPDARVCDAGCGSGGDVPALLAAVPEGEVTAIDKHKPFIDALLARHGGDPRLTAYAGDMAKLKGPFDFIWSAGAVYFLGVRKALNCWRPALAKGGAIAFSGPCFFTDTPSEEARAFWGDYQDTMTEPQIGEEVMKAGYVTIAARPVADAAWEAFYAPLEARIAALRKDADETMSAVMDIELAQAETWRRVRRETGYLLSVVRPA